MILFYFVLVANSVTHTVAATPEELADSVKNYRSQCYGHEFTLKVKAQFDSSNTDFSSKSGRNVPLVKVNTTERFCILAPLKGETRPWRKWERFISHNAKEYQRFYTFNGKQTGMFSLRHRDDPKKWNSALIVPFEDTSYFGDNMFDRFLCMDMKGFARYYFPDDNISKQVKYEWEKPQAIKFADYDAYSLIGHYRQNGVTISIELLAPPQSCIVKRETTLKGETIPSKVWKVLEIGNFEGFLYPKHGTFHQVEKDYQPGIDYAFEVTSIRTVDDKIRKRWNINWPTGSIVNDQITKKKLTIPHTENQLQEVQKQLLILEIRTWVKSRFGEGVGLWFVILSPVFLLAFIIWRYRRKRTG